MRWTVEILDSAVAAEIRIARRYASAPQPACPSDTGVRFSGAAPWQRRHLEDKLWELRITGQDGISRVIYLTASGQRVVMLRAFVKKTGKTPRRELEVARQRARKAR